MEQEFQSRMQKVINVPYLTSNQEELKYFLGYSGSNGFLVIETEGFHFFTDSRYYDEYSELLGFEKISLIDKNDHYRQIATYLKSKNFQTILLDFQLWTHQEFIDWQQIFFEMKIVINPPAERPSLLRRLKTELEIDKIRQSQKILDKAFISIISFLKEGVLELDIRHELEYQIKKKGAENIAFESIVLFGKRTAFPHGKSGLYSLKKADEILIDAGAVFQNYCSDMTRMFSFGEPSTEFLDHYQLLLSIQKDCIAQIKENIPLKNLDSFVRNRLKEYQLESFFTHSLGHGVGIDIHENPFLSEKSEDVLQKGNVFTIEPGIYIKNQYGIRIEDLIVMQNKDQYEVLAQFPKDLLIL